MSLDPQTNAEQAAQQRQAQAGTPEEDQPLDPVFPFTVIPFDPTAFGSVADPDPAAV